ncbi:MAG TPA: glycine dehydrogenase, partial [Thermoleophilia bacterium]|nr:glycine dehydrogenase [Thermoleophilia bacterium]
MRFVPHSEQDVREMLDAVGVSSLDDLFQTIPGEVRFGGRLGLPEPAAEADVLRELDALAARNTPASRLVSFLGGGVYDGYVPSVVDAITGRSEFFTSYTPYQAERSQGVLQAIFEFQTAICELTGLDVSNASMYDGATALA